MYKSLGVKCEVLLFLSLFSLFFLTFVKQDVGPLDCWSTKKCTYGHVHFSK